jgi:hypothetical protein
MEKIFFGCFYDGKNENGELSLNSAWENRA